MPPGGERDFIPWGSWQDAELGKHWTTFPYYYLRRCHRGAPAPLDCFMFLLCRFVLYVFYFYYFILILYVGDRIVAIIRKSIYLVLEAKF